MNDVCTNGQDLIKKVSLDSRKTLVLNPKYIKLRSDRFSRPVPYFTQQERVAFELAYSLVTSFWPLHGEVGSFLTVELPKCYSLNSFFIVLCVWFCLHHTYAFPKDIRIVY